MSTQEKVLVIPRSLFEEIGSFQGLQANIEKYLPCFLDPANHSFLERSKAEEDPSFKQIIPYIVITCGDRILHYRRGTGSGEKRLLKKRSLGIGGHINDEDGLTRTFHTDRDEEAAKPGGASQNVSLTQHPSVFPDSAVDQHEISGLGSHFDAAAYERALRRELDEELHLPDSFRVDQIQPLALLNDDSNPVGAVHLGVVHHCALLSDTVLAKEEAIAELGFLTHPELLERIEEFETWSQIVIRGWKELYPLQN